MSAAFVVGLTVEQHRFHAFAPREAATAVDLFQRCDERFGKVGDAHRLAVGDMIARELDKV